MGPASVKLTGDLFSSVCRDEPLLAAHVETIRLADVGERPLLTGVGLGGGGAAGTEAGTTAVWLTPLLLLLPPLPDHCHHCLPRP
jgi:hypothetical protein